METVQIMFSPLDLLCGMLCSDERNEQESLKLGVERRPEQN
jgi:hypothetical protein